MKEDIEGIRSVVGLLVLWNIVLTMLLAGTIVLAIVK
jgi:hypothetical protein